MPESDSGSWSLLRRIADLFHPSQQQAPTGPQPLVDRLEDSLSRVKTLAEGLEGGATQQQVESARERQEVLDRDAPRAAMRRTIEALHETLRTGVIPDELERSRAFCLRLQRELDARKGGNLRQRIEASAGLRAHGECGRLAWDRLTSLMKQADFPWPRPEALAPGTTQQELEATSERNRRQAREAFLAASLKTTGEIIVGTVSIWRSVYPEEGSWLWNQVALEGVAGALRARYLYAAIEIFKENPEELIEEIRATLGKELDSVQEVLHIGVRSISEAQAVTSAVDTMCNQVVPDMIWAYVEQHVQDPKPVPPDETLGLDAIPP